MKMIVNAGPVNTNQELLIFNGNEKIATIPVVDSNNIVNLIIEQFNKYDFLELCFLAPSVWANNIIRRLKSHEIDEIYNHEIKYSVIYQEGKLRSREKNVNISN